MISYGKQLIDKDDIDAVNEVLAGDWLTQGPKVKEFEEGLCKYFGADHACVVSNGTAALHLAAIALGWGPGDIIITSPITFLATVNSIYYVGATPDFVDIDPVSYTLDLDKLESKIKKYISDGKNVKAIIGVDYAGHPCDWKKLKDIADNYNIQLVNDNCHAMGAVYNENKQYAVKYADIVTQSFHPVKHITTGEGGAILSNSLEIDNKVRSNRSHGMTKDSKILEQNQGPWYYEMHEPGFNYRITDFQCALGLSQLKKLDNFIKIRREIANFYNQAFTDYDFITTPHLKENISHAYHLYPILINFEKLKLSKKDFFEKMHSSGISLQVHYIPVHLQPFYRKNYGFKIGDFPHSEKFYEQEISLPVYPRLTKHNLNDIILSISQLIN